MSQAAASAEGFASLGTGRLKQQLRRTERTRKLTAFGLVAPLLAFIIVNFVVPVGIILFKSVDDREVSSILPTVSAALDAWDGDALPDEAAFTALAQDLRKSVEDKTIVKLGKRLNSARSGFNALINKTARRLLSEAPPSHQEALIAIDERWSDLAYWSVLKRTTGTFTPVYLLAALDLRLSETGEIVRVPEYQRVFVTTWVRTFWMALVITLLCFILGYPLAYLLAHLPPGRRNLVMVLILIPFWTSLLVRTTAWLVLLQDQGLINGAAISLGLWSAPVQLVHNRLGVYITMTHILLPYMILPIYGAMGRIPPSYMRAARSLGATPIGAFIKVYLPLTTQGIGAGSLFVFILAIGFYITPALVGGRQDQMISYFIAFYTNEVLNWGAAAALSALLLLLTLVVFFVFRATFRLGRVQLA